MSKSNKESRVATEREKKNFELTFLVSLRDSEKINSICKEIEGFLSSRGGEILEVEKEDNEEFKGGKGKIWVEKRKMAYSIKKERACYFITLWLNLNTANLEDFKRFLKLQNKIMRFMLVSQENIFAMVPSRNALLIENIDDLPKKETGGFARREEKKFTPFVKKTEIERVEPIKEEAVKEVVASETEDAKIEEVEMVSEPVVEAVEEEISLSSPEVEEEGEKEAVVEEESVNKETESEEMTVPEVSLEAESVIEEKLAEEPSEEEVSKELEKMASTEETSQVEEEKVSSDESMAVEEPAFAKATAVEGKKDEEGKEKPSKQQKKITLEELDSRLDDILNEDIL